MGRHWALWTERVRCSQSANPDGARNLPLHPLPGPPACVLSPWEELLPWMVTISEVSWELAPLLT